MRLDNVSFTERIQRFQLFFLSFLDPPPWLFSISIPHPPSIHLNQFYTTTFYPVSLVLSLSFAISFFTPQSFWYEFWWTNVCSYPFISCTFISCYFRESFTLAEGILSVGPGNVAGIPPNHWSVSYDEISYAACIFMRFFFNRLARATKGAEGWTRGAFEILITMVQIHK